MEITKLTFEENFVISGAKANPKFPEIKSIVASTPLPFW